MADWQAIKTEYITTETSYRKLAQKHGIGYQAICHRSKEEGWIAMREQHKNNTTTKTLEKISPQEANRAARIHTVADKLLNKIEALVDRPGIMPKDVRSLVAAVKDLKEIQSIKSDLDEQEQKARIANLRRNVEKDEEESSTIEVVFAAGPEEWNE